MTTYIVLFGLTDAGIKAAKDSPRRLDASKKLLADMGGEMKQFYMVMGDFDFVGICEVPDDAVMARYVLQLGGLGFVRTKTLKGTCHNNLALAKRKSEGLGSSSGRCRGPPILQRFASEDAERVAGNKMALNVERILDGGVNGQEPLR